MLFLACGTISIQSVFCTFFGSLIREIRSAIKADFFLRIRDGNGRFENLLICYSTFVGLGHFCPALTLSRKIRLYLNSYESSAYSL
jgi:hypothetical protein